MGNEAKDEEDEDEEEKEARKVARRLPFSAGAGGLVVAAAAAAAAAAAGGLERSLPLLSTLPPPSLPPSLAGLPRPAPFAAAAAVGERRPVVKSASRAAKRGLSDRRRGDTAAALPPLSLSRLPLSPLPPPLALRLALPPRCTHSPDGVAQSDLRGLLDRPRAVAAGGGADPGAAGATARGGFTTASQWLAFREQTQNTR